MTNQLVPMNFYNVGFGPVCDSLFFFAENRKTAKMKSIEPEVEKIHNSYYGYCVNLHEFWKKQVGRITNIPKLANWWWAVMKSQESSRETSSSTATSLLNRTGNIPKRANSFKHSLSRPEVTRHHLPVALKSNTIDETAHSEIGR